LTVYGVKTYPWETKRALGHSGTTPELERAGSRLPQLHSGGDKNLVVPQYGEILSQTQEILLKCLRGRRNSRNRPPARASIDATRQSATLPPMQFYQLAIGAKFFAHGQSFRKTAISMATDGKIGHVIMAETEVEPDGEPMLLPPEEAAKWKPSEVHWTEHLPRAPRGTGLDLTRLFL